jgi:hypothetical protein
MNFRDSEESDCCVIEVLSQYSSEATEERFEKTSVSVVGGLLDGKMTFFEKQLGSYW